MKRRKPCVSICWSTKYICTHTHTHTHTHTPPHYTTTPHAKYTTHNTTHTTGAPQLGFEKTSEEDQCRFRRRPKHTWKDKLTCSFSLCLCVSVCGVVFVGVGVVLCLC